MDQSPRDPDTEAAEESARRAPLETGPGPDPADEAAAQRTDAEPETTEQPNDDGTEQGA